MSEFVSEKSEMSALTEASVLVRRAAEPRPVGDSVKAAIGRAARRLGFQYSRTKDIWYEDARQIHAQEMDTLRARSQQRGEQEARADVCLAIERLVGLRAALAAADADFHRTSILALDDALRAMGAAICPLAIPED